MLRFYYVPDVGSATHRLGEQLSRELTAGKRVTWLVSGGSNIPLSVLIMNSLPRHLQSNLTILLIDERFGPLDHQNSNRLQLREAGFDPGEARIIPVLVANASLEETCSQYETAVTQTFAESDIIIAQLGIGSDGHIGGILPHSAAVTDDRLVASYQSDPYTRIAITTGGLRHVTAAYAFVYGETKRVALERLQNERLPLSEEPAQILKELPSADVYNDQIGETG